VVLWKARWGALGLVLLGLLAGWCEVAARDAEGPQITFLDAREAAEAIIDDELEPYFARLQRLEMSAKTGRPITGEGLENQRAECRRRYAEATQDFSTDETAAVVWAVSEIQPHLRRNYPRMGYMGWSFIKVGSHIEGGLPHTRGRHIVLSSRLLKNCVEIHDRGHAEKLAAMRDWLLHEQMHVFQRRNPDLFHRLYTKLWGFRRVESVGEHPWLTAHQLVNPDGLDGYWVFPVRTGETTTWIWPTLVLVESWGMRRLLGVPSMSRDMRMIAVELVPGEDGFSMRLDANGQPVFRRLLSFQEYRKEFPFAVAPYHPAEIAAEGFARIVTSSLVREAEGGNGGRLGPRTEALRRWFAEHLD
jgi:hypothetical protein